MPSSCVWVSHLDKTRAYILKNFVRGDSVAREQHIQLQKSGKDVSGTPGDIMSQLNAAKDYLIHIRKRSFQLHGINIAVTITTGVTSSGRSPF